MLSQQRARRARTGRWRAPPARVARRGGYTARKAAPTRRVSRAFSPSRAAVRAGPRRTRQKHARGAIRAPEKRAFFGAGARAGAGTETPWKKPCRNPRKRGTSARGRAGVAPLSVRVLRGF
jgi:hypothetical protein